MVILLFIIVYFVFLIFVFFFFFNTKAFTKMQKVANLSNINLSEEDAVAGKYITSKLCIVTHTLKIGMSSKVTSRFLALFYFINVFNRSYTSSKSRTNKA
jgi:hypothetical protein